MSAGSSTDAPPTRRASGARAKQSRPQRPLSELRRELVEAYGIAGLALQQFRPLAAIVVVKQAEACADAWIAAAEAFPYVRQVLEVVGKGSIPFALLTAHMPVWVALAVENGQMPPDHPWAKEIEPEIRHVQVMMARQQQEAERQAAAAAADPGEVPPGA